MSLIPFETWGMERMYFICEKDMNVGDPGAEYYGVKVYVLPKCICWNSTTWCNGIGVGGWGGYKIVVVVVQLLSHVQFFVTPWTAACQASLSFSISQSLLKPMSIESTISSSVIPFSCLQSFPASGSFLMSWLFTSDGQGVGYQIRWHHKDGVLTNGISALQGAEETRVLPFFQVRTEVRTRKESLIRHQISWCLDLGLPNHQNCGKSMYVINHLIYGIFVIVSWLNWDTYLKQTLFLNMDLNVAIMLHTWAILSY